VFAHHPTSSKPALVSTQERRTVPAGEVRNELRIALKEHLGAGVAQPSGDPLRIFPGGKHQRRKGMPRLIEGAGPEARPFQGWVPDPPPERVDVDGPAVLIQEDIVAAQPFVSAVPQEQIADGLEHLDVTDALLGFGQALVFADPSLADYNFAVHVVNVSPFERNLLVGTYARQKCDMEMSVQETSSDPKGPDTTVWGGQGASVRGRNLGPSARCSDVFPRPEDPQGRARGRDEYRGGRAGAPGLSEVCP
jgi:hypothetical protein